MRRSSGRSSPSVLSRRADLIEDPRFAKKADRLSRSRELIALLDIEFAKHDRAHWRKELTARGIVFDVVATPAGRYPDRPATAR